MEAGFVAFLEISKSLLTRQIAQHQAELRTDATAGGAQLEPVHNRTPRCDGEDSQVLGTYDQVSTRAYLEKLDLSREEGKILAPGEGG